MRLKSHYQKKTLFGKTISIASPPKKETLVMLNASTDATKVALPKENTIWKDDFNRFTTKKGDFSHKCKHRCD